VTEEELLAMADTAADEAVIEREERKLIHSIIDFGDTVAREVMVPRPDMVTVSADAMLGAAADIASAAGFSRVPVYGKGIDDIVGVVYVKDMMRAERDRDVLSAQISHADFLQALDLKVDLFRARTEDLGRITQLINKTNQFNLTTIRRTLDEVRELANSDDWRLYGLRVTDKFGEYGLTGVIIAKIAADRRLWTIDTLLMSCRVLGRGVETALIGAMTEDARAEGAAAFAASFIPTAKNALCASFLPDQGFSPAGDQDWRLDLADAPAIPSHISRLGAEAAGGLGLDAVAIQTQLTAVAG